MLSGDFLLTFGPGLGQAIPVKQNTSQGGLRHFQGVQGKARGRAKGPMGLERLEGLPLAILASNPSPGLSLNSLELRKTNSRRAPFKGIMKGIRAHLKVA